VLSRQSMVTTAVFDELELSIPSSAANPPKEAPYPTLVGTQITGAATSPRYDAGKCPFHAGANDQDVRATEEIALRQQPMQARDSNIAELLNSIAHNIGCLRRNQRSSCSRRGGRYRR
jgi:hypothetical protein